MVIHTPPLDVKSRPPERTGWWAFVRRHVPSLSVMLMALALIVVLLWPYMIVTVPSGHVGVLWKRFSGPGIYCWCILSRGTVLNPKELRDEGLHVIWPWDTLFIYNLRLQATTEKYTAISKDGVNVTAEINIRYQLNHDSIALFHKFIGPGYLTSLLGPEIGSQTRTVISGFPATDVYVRRSEIEEQIKRQAQITLGAKLNRVVQPAASEQSNSGSYRDSLQGSIDLLDTLVLSIELPPAIVAAINRQTEQFYMIQEYRFRVQREAEESRRKQVEADGIAAFQRTVSQGKISDSYLRWRGIEATLQLAQSSNSKIVVIGTGKDGLPIILGNTDFPGSSGAAPPGETGGAPSRAAAEAPNSPPKGAAPPRATPNPGTSPTDAPSPAESHDRSAKLDKSWSPSSPLDLTELETLLSRVLSALRSLGSDSSVAAGGKPKE
jgi:regulator of protease activity HflC (stomatin/prohibitin superfamily)